MTRARFKVLAKSVIHPGNYLLCDLNGDCYVYFGDCHELSRTAVDQSLADAMMQSYEWSATPGGDWLTLDELRRSTLDPASQSPADASSQPEMS